MVYWKFLSSGERDVGANCIGEKLAKLSTGETCERFPVAGLPDHTDLCGPAEVTAAHGDVDADGCYSSFHGWAEPNGSIDDVAEHDAEREHDEHYVDERHGNGGVPGHGFHGDVDVAR